MDMLAYNHVECNYLETLRETFPFPARQNHFVQKKIFQQFSIAMNSVSAIFG